jgi:putative sporulation protein YyaC
MTYYIDRTKENAAATLSCLLKMCIRNCKKDWEELVFLCIGSDRITGDCLGPYIGHQLSHSALPHTMVYGTLSQPVHALNLKRTIKTIQQTHPRSLIIAIDASLGEKQYLGYITVGKGSIYPGSGVHKELPAVGDVYITGIVCISGFLDQVALQNTRLSQVIALAEIITDGILSLYPLTPHRSCFPITKQLRKIF